MNRVLLLILFLLLICVQASAYFGDRRMDTSRFIPQDVFSEGAFGEGGDDNTLQGTYQMQFNGVDMQYSGTDMEYTN